MRGLTLLLLIGCADGGGLLQCPPGTTALDGECLADVADSGPQNEDASVGVDAEPGDGPIIEADAGSSVDGGTIVDAGEGWSVRVEPLELHFGILIVGSTRDRSVLVTNDGDIPSTISLTAISGSDAGAFTSLELELGEARLLNPGDSLSIPLRFTPARAGRHEAELVLDLCNAGCISTVTLIGDGVEEDTPFACQSGLRVVMNAGTCVTRTLTCINASSEPVNVLELEIPGSIRAITWMLEPVTLPASVAPGAEFDFDLEICSDESGTRVTPDVRVTVDDVAPERIIEIELDIESIDVRDGCYLEISDWRVNFGRVPIGEAVVRSVRIRNRAEVDSRPCEIEPLVASSDFAVSTAPFVLDPGAAGEVQVSFTPIGAGAAEALLVLHPAYNVDLAGHAFSDPRPAELLIDSRSELFVEGAGDELPWVGGKDDGYALVPIPFAFEFLGNPVSEAWVSANGFISFETLPPSTLINGDFPEAPAPNSSVAWWWDDLVIDGATMQWVDGTAPDRVLHVQLLDVVHALGSPLFAVEIRLFEGSHAIELHYASYPLGTFKRRPEFTGEYSASAGWEGPSGLIGQDLLGCSPTCRDWDWPWNIVYRVTP